MTLLSWFSDRFRRQAERYIYAPIPASNVRHQDASMADSRTLTAGENYFRVWLVEMFLKNDRDWFSSWYPAVYSAVTFQFAGSPQVLTSVVNQSKQKDLVPKDLGAGDLNKFVIMSRELTGLLPFNDGTVTVDAGLIGMQGNNDLKDLIKAMGTFGSLLAAPQLSAAMKVAAPLVDAVASLIGVTKGELMIGMSQTFSEQGGGAEAVLRAGYYAMIDATGANLERQKLWVIEDRLQYGNTAETSEPLTGYNYLLLRMERRDQRDDWDWMASIHGPYQSVLNALQTGSVEQAQVHLKSAIAAALAAPELTKKVDRRRVVEALRANFEKDKDALMGAGAFARVNRSLQHLMEDAIDPKEAAAKPLIGAKEAFAGLD
jgi:hypothetical protein